MTTPEQDPFVGRNAKGERVTRAAAKSEPEPEQVDEGVPSGTSKEVLAWVGDDKEKAKKALEAEESYDKPRSGLVKSLREVASEEDDDE